MNAWYRPRVRTVSGDAEKVGAIPGLFLKTVITTKGTIMPTTMLCNRNSTMLYIGKAMRRARIGKRITTHMLAEKIGVRECDLWSVESSGAGHITLEQYYEIARLLDLPFDMMKTMELGKEVKSSVCMVEFFDREVQANADDFIPIKNHLPVDLEAKLKTKVQWNQQGFKIKPDAKPYKLHPSVMARKTHDYFYAEDIETENPTR